MTKQGDDLPSAEIIDALARLKGAELVIDAGDDTSLVRLARLTDLVEALAVEVEALRSDPTASPEALRIVRSAMTTLTKAVDDLVDRIVP